MHSILFITFFVGLITFTTSSDVLVFTDSDFETKVKQYDILLAEFYAPWCGHCRFNISVSLSKSLDECFLL